MRMMLVTGGTGGHIYPALALADAAVKRYGKEAEIVFVGNDDRMEATLIPQRGYAFLPLHTSGLVGGIKEKSKAVAQMLMARRKAGGYIFDGTAVKVLDKRGENGVIYELEFYRENTEVNEMNEYDRLHRQAQRYKELYPEGTRILLLHMGDDPRPVEDDRRGTVMFVDDMSTVHCKFDNGRQLGVVPGEDSFRRLTEQELAEEQEMSEAQDFGMKMQ